MTNLPDFQTLSLEETDVDGSVSSSSQATTEKNNIELGLSSLSQLSTEVRRKLTYPMNNTRCRGIAIIFNHRKYEVPGKELTERSGTEKDCKRLKKCLKQLRLELRIYNDKKRKEIEKILFEVSCYDHRKNDCLVVIVLTHGERGILFAKDDSYQPETLWNYFTESRCSSLVGKPKLFFIQACRGERLDPGITIPVRMTNTLEMMENNNLTEVFSKSNYRSVEIEEKIKSGFQQVFEADFVIAFATVPEFVSWRNHSGSWFIQFLCQELTEKHSTHHLSEILTFVSRSVAIERESHSLDEEMNMKKQMLCIESTLTKLVFFG